MSLLLFYFLSVNMRKKGNELKRKQQIRTQVSLYVGKNELLKVSMEY